MTQVKWAIVYVDKSDVIDQRHELNCEWDGQQYFEIIQW